MKAVEGITARVRGAKAPFGWFWFAQAVSLIGEQVRELALPLVAIGVLHASAGELGLLGMSQWLPFLLLAMPIGVLVDRRRRRRLLVLTEWSRAALSGALVVAVLVGVLSLPMLLAVVFAIGCFAVVYEVGYQSAVPSLVDPAGYERANARLQSTAAVAQVGGPGIAGLLLQLVGAPITLIANSGAYLLSGIALSRISAGEPRPTTSGESFTRDLRAGVRHVLGDRFLLANVGFSALYNPFAQWIVTLLTLHAVTTLRIGAGGIGLVFALGATGAVAGAAAVEALTRRFRAGRILVTCAAVECVVLLLIPLVPADWAPPVIISALSCIWAVNGAATSASGVMLTTLRQLRTPDELRGRVSAAMRTVTYGTVAFGALAGGAAATLIGTTPALLLGAALSLGTVLWVARSPLAGITRLSDLQQQRTHDA